MIVTILLKVLAFLIGTAVFLRVVIFRKKKALTKEAYDRLQDQVVLVTGASSGLGAELARTFYQHGAKVILASRRREELERVKEELLESTTSPSVKTHEPKVSILDLGSENVGSIEKTAQEIVDIFGRLDILINNAGISSRALAIDTKVDVDRQIMLVNYLNQIALTKVILKSMVAKPQSEIPAAHRGHIVAISSVQGRIAIPSRSSYSASKHAAQAFYDSLRAELSVQDQATSRPVDVTVVSPGYIKTSLSLNALNSDGSKYAKMDTATAAGLEPSNVATQVLEALLNRQHDLVICPLLHKLIIILRAICPNLYFFIMNQYAKKK